MSLGNRIKLIRDKLSQKDFGAKFSATPNTIRSYETDSTPPNTDFISAICKSYNLNSEWLLFGEGPMYKELKGINRQTQDEQQPLYVDENGETIIPRWKDPDPEMFDYIPMAETKLSAGGGSFVLSENFEGYYAFRKSWLSAVAASPRKLVLMRVTGDSMSPTIQANDTVLIDIGRRDIKEGLIYAIRFESTVMIKRLAFRPGGRIMVISDNRAEFDSYEVDIKDLHVLGQVIFFSRVFVPE
jgi:phage repressor protein C with HTH and peptisase S24 domain